MAKNKTRKLIIDLMSTLEAEKKEYPDQARHLQVCYTKLEDVLYRYNTLDVREPQPTTSQPPTLAAVQE